MKKVVILFAFLLAVFILFSSCDEGNTQNAQNTATVQHTHTVGKWIVDKAATCIEAGNRHRDCISCGETIETESISKTGHTEVTDKAVAATCTTAGKTTGKHCSACGKVIVAQTTIPAKGHTLGAWVVDKAATCTATGSKHQNCTVCGAKINTETIPAKGHTLGAWVVDKAATCTETGSKHQNCTVCGEIINTESIAAKGHIEVTDEAVAATCTTSGKTAGKHCSVCGEITVAQTVIPAKGHTWSKWIVDQAATCTVTGSKHQNCTVCGEIKKETIPSAHNYQGGVCTKCGERKPSEGLLFASYYYDDCIVSGIGSCTDTVIVIPSVSPDGKNVIGIGSNAFYGCTALTEITIPNSIEEIGTYALCGCSGLTSVIIPDSVNSIGFAAFNSCTGLTSITIPFVGSSRFYTASTYTNFGYIFGAYSYKDHSNRVPPSLKTVIITGGTSIEAYAFSNIHPGALTSITIPKSVTFIGKKAFCDGLHVPITFIFQGTKQEWQSIRKESGWNIEHVWEDGTTWYYSGEVEQYDANHKYIGRYYILSINCTDGVIHI